MVERHRVEGRRFGLLADTHDDAVDWPAFLTATVVLAAAYIISRGIAKAGKVYEHR